MEDLAYRYSRSLLRFRCFFFIALLAMITALDFEPWLFDPTASMQLKIRIIIITALYILLAALGCHLIWRRAKETIKLGATGIEYERGRKRLFLPYDQILEVRSSFQVWIFTTGQLRIKTADAALRVSALLENGADFLKTLQLRLTEAGAQGRLSRETFNRYWNNYHYFGGSWSRLRDIALEFLAFGFLGLVGGYALSRLTYRNPRETLILTAAGLLFPMVLYLVIELQFLLKFTRAAKQGLLPDTPRDATAERRFYRRGLAAGAVIFLGLGAFTYHLLLARMDLHQAAERGAIPRMQALLAAGAKVNARDKGQRTPLFLAVKSGHLDAVGLLLENHARVNVEDENEYSPLHWAVWFGRRDAVAMLIAHHADLEARGFSIDAPLILAAKKGDRGLVELLLSSGAAINPPDNDSTPLHEAVRANHKEIVESLLDQGAALDAQDESGSTPLHLAARKGFADIAGLLLARGAKVEQDSKCGQTPLHAAASEGKKEIAALLIEHGANVNAKDSRGLTPLHLAAFDGRAEIAEFLITNGADVNATTLKGLTPLHEAMHAGDKKVVELLIEKGADLNARATDGIFRGLTPLGLAEQKGTEEIEDLLRLHGAVE